MLHAHSGIKKINGISNYLHDDVLSDPLIHDSMTIRRRVVVVLVAAALCVSFVTLLLFSTRQNAAAFHIPLANNYLLLLWSCGQGTIRIQRRSNR